MTARGRRWWGRALAIWACATAAVPLAAQDERLRDDWASLARYREANARLGPPQPDERRVVLYRVVMPRPVMQYILKKFRFVASREYLPDEYGDSVEVWSRAGFYPSPVTSTADRGGVTVGSLPEQCL